MNHEQARQMAIHFINVEKFAKVRINRDGEYNDKTTATATDFRVDIWTSNAKSGNTTVEHVKSYTADFGKLARIAKVARGKSNAKDRAAYARMAAEASC